MPISQRPHVPVDLTIVASPIIQIAVGEAPGLAYAWSTPARALPSAHLPTCSCPGLAGWRPDFRAAVL